MYKLWVQDRFWSINLKDVLVSIGGADCQVKLRGFSSESSTAKLSKILNSLRQPCWFSTDDICKVFVELKDYCEEACFEVFRNRSEIVPIAIVTRFDDEWLIHFTQPGLDLLPAFENHEKHLTVTSEDFVFTDVKTETYFYSDGQICSSDGSIFASLG